MSGLSQMSSTSSGGSSIITLTFSLDLSLDVAEQEVQAAINAANNLLPTDLPTPPPIKKVKSGRQCGHHLSCQLGYSAADAGSGPGEYPRCAQALAISGVGMVTLAGGHQPAIRVQMNPQALAAHGLTLEDVNTLIGNSKRQRLKGGLMAAIHSVTIDANDQLRTAAEYGNLILTYQKRRRPEAEGHRPY